MSTTRRDRVFDRIVPWAFTSVTDADDNDMLLPRPPGLIRRFWMRHTRLADVLIALFVLLASYLEAVDSGRGLGRLDYLAHGFFWVPIVVAAAMLIRRTRPLVTAGTAIAASCVLTIAADRPETTSLVFAIYAVAVYAGALKAWISAAVAFGLYLASALLASVSIGGASFVLVVLIITLLVGSNLGNRRRYLDALISRAEQLARERDQQAQLATAAERARIAREMHDIVAHSLSVMVRLSDGAEMLAETDPARAREAAHQIGVSGRDALTEMRRLLGVLREEGDAQAVVATTPQPTLGDLDHLLESYRAAGLPVAIQQSGVPPTAEGVQVVIYRAVQEALTNALRYSKQPSRVLVKLDYSATGTVVDVSDDGFLSTPAPSVGSNRGLVGLRERAALYGGVVEAGPRGQDGSGWRMHMTLPQAEGTSR